MSTSTNSTQSVIARAQTMIAGVPKSGENIYNLSPEQLAAVTPTALIAATAALVPLRAQIHSAVQAKDALKDGVSTALSRAAATAYASSATDAQLATIGLAPRRAGSSRPKAAVTPHGLTLSLQTNGNLLLKWLGANARGTIYTVESSVDGVVFSMLKAVTRRSFVVENPTPGVPIWLRVTASTGAGTSVPSAPVSAYAPGTPGLTVVEGGRKAA